MKDKLFILFHTSQKKYTFLILFVLVLSFNSGISQEIAKQNDTFFLAKKKGFLGRFGKSISTTPPDEIPAKVVNPFIKYKGKIIRSIETVRLGFEYNIDDTNQVKHNFGVEFGKKFHKNTSDKNIMRNLFFKEGDPLFPYLLADNERYLRELEYIKDARILVDYAEGSTDSVDVVILTKDIFSIGVNFSMSSVNKGRLQVREENFMGSGTRLLLGSYYENERSPDFGITGEFIRRNIGGSFINWVSAYSDYKNAFTSNRNQETVIYTRFEKPLVTPFVPVTGALEWSYQKTRNFYDADSIYSSDIKYAYYNLDAWFGYNLNSKRALYAKKEIKVHRFVSIRGFKQHFLTLPTKYKTDFDYRFSDYTGVLASLNIFKQLFYKTSFIYGFGVSEDIPEGFGIALTGGFVNKRSIQRPYISLDLSLANFKKRGFYSNYTFRAGGYFYKNRFEDVDLVFYLEHFTRLKKMSSTWYQRTFINTGIAAQVNPVLNTPLFLNSIYGLPYFNNGNINADMRTTVKVESVFYNTAKLLGFRFAPFIFADMSLLKPAKMNLDKTSLYSALGGGVRTRNENLVFGTIELKAYYFPRVIGEMKGWKIDLSSSIRFKYKNILLTRPDFIVPN